VTVLLLHRQAGAGREGMPPRAARGGV